MPVRVAVNGFGTIGKRVADAVAKQPDMQLVGVAKTRPSFEARLAAEKGYTLFVGGDGRTEDFRAAGLAVEGTTDEMFKRADVVVDATPDKVGREHSAKYAAANLKAIYQGGEKPDVAELSFSALANYDAAKGKSRVRVVSCNTTGIVRAASVLRARYGVEWWDATLIRRAADPTENKKGPVNAILPTFQFPSHHAPDAQTIFPDLPITTMALVVPTTLMHVHVNHVRLRKPPASTADVVAAFRETPRFQVFRSWEHVEGTPQVLEYARDHASPRGDMMANVVWEDGVHLEGADLHFFQAIHQESIVVPENIDAIRAMFNLAPNANASIAVTDMTLGLRAKT
ncbi:MAG: type II glyceraldehyde-3-phosphate dehydrogenase [Thermoplasmata archaeon]